MTRKIGLIVVVLLVLYIPAWFIYTRFCLDKYEMTGNTLRFKNNTYVFKDHSSTSDEENLGKTIGIGINGKRGIFDFIWPYWVIEYKNDIIEHNGVYVRGIMGSGGPYKKISE